MLPDFPRAKELIVRQTNKVLRALVNEGPALAGFRQYHYHEGRGSAPYGEKDDGKVNFHRVEAPHELPIDELVKWGPVALLERIPALAGVLTAQLEQHLLKRVGELAKEGGPVKGVKSPPSTCEEHLEILATFPIEFDVDGTPQLPSVLNPSAEYLERLQQWQNDPDCQAKLRELLKQKREEFDAREGNRRLVD